MINLKSYQIRQTLHQEKHYKFFRAIRLEDKQPVIIKTHVDEIPSTQQYHNLMREFEIGQAFKHPNIIEYYALEKVEHRLALIMEDFNGAMLAELVPSQGFLLHDFLTIALQLAKALGAIHQQHIIHQAISSDNILIDPTLFTVKVVDFISASRLTHETQAPVASNAISLTKLAYISPEQTGRINRSIDYRTDFYSLGIVFYQMLCGHLPFVTNDPLELVYCHIAKTPVFPHEKKNQVPPVIFSLIEKLLAKNAEDRYQSAYGLVADLQECLSQLQVNGEIQDFRIGQYDALDRLCIPQKLYGREMEIQLLLNAYKEVSEGKTDNVLLLVHGYSGVGKSFLINEIRRPLLQAGGYFIGGKCDRYEHNVPYAAFIQAFRHLIRYLLMETEDIIAQWKIKLLAALGSNGQIRNVSQITSQTFHTRKGITL